MPTYEYQCTKCGHTFEALQGIRDAPLSTCPECRGPVKRLISAGLGVIFKGSGFYTTDYKRSSSLSGNGSSSSKTPSAEGKEKPKESVAEKAPAS